MRSTLPFLSALVVMALLVACGEEGYREQRPEPAPLSTDSSSSADEAASLPSEQVDNDNDNDSPPADLSRSAQPELPGPGDLCPEALCDDSALCIGGICHRKCKQPLPSCNDVVKACTADEVCLPATSFTDACFFASAKTGEPCGSDAEGAICRSGNLCVLVSETGPALCLKLCKYGCPQERCVATDNGCSVCLPD